MHSGRGSPGSGMFGVEELTDNLDYETLMRLKKSCEEEEARFDREVREKVANMTEEQKKPYRDILKIEDAERRAALEYWKPYIDYALENSKAREWIQDGNNN